MQRFTELAVWQRGHAFTLAIYDATRSFPKDELFGLTSQLRAEASLAEVESLLMLSRDLGNLSEPKTSDLIDEAQEVARMLCALRRKVELAERIKDRPRTVNCRL